MPARSKAQQSLMAMCEHGIPTTTPCPHMTHQQFHDFAATPRSELPARVAGLPHPSLRPHNSRPPTDEDYARGYQRVD